MANKQNHIDLFFEEKLGQIEEQSVLSLQNSILAHIHPIDSALNETLSRLEEMPENISLEQLLVLAKDAPSPIDLMLYEKLRHYQSAPDKEISVHAYPEKKKRRKGFLIFVALTLASTASYLVYSGLNTRDSKSNSSISIKKSEAILNGKSPLNTDVFNSDSTHETNGSNMDKVSVEPKVLTEAPLQNLFYKQPQKLYKNYTFSEKFIPPSILQPAYDVHQNLFHIPIETIKKRNIGYALAEPEMLNSKEISRPLQTKLTKIGIHFNLGFLNAINQNETDADRLHKDAIQNFQKSSSETRRGIQISLQMNFPISRRLQFRTGLQYSYSSVSKSFDYVYDELAVYDSTGQILGYFKRPAQQSPRVNEPVISQSQSLHLPTVLLFKLGAFQGAHIYIGAGADLVLQEQFSSQIFSFETESMQAVKNQKKQALFQSRLIVMYEKRISKQMYLNFSFQNLFGRQNVLVDHITYKNRVFSPSINLGMTYYPLKKQP